MNIVGLIMTMRGIHQHNTTTIRKDINKHNKLQMIGTQARRAFTCSVLLGITWLFGIMAVGDLRIFFQILFCVFNSLQGFFIIIFYVLRDPDVYKECMGCLGMRKEKDRSLSENSNLWHTSGELLKPV